MFFISASCTTGLVYGMFSKTGLLVVVRLRYAESAPHFVEKVWGIHSKQRKSLGRGGNLCSNDFHGICSKNGDFDSEGWRVKETVLG